MIFRLGYHGTTLAPMLTSLFLGALALGAMPPFLYQITDTASGYYRETLLTADIDRDGDMDFFSGEGRASPLWWFEKQGSTWVRQLASDTNVADVGAALIDVDGDGWVDRASSGIWYRNPAGKGTRFSVCRYSEQQYLHDILIADIDRDDRSDIVSIDFDGIRWHRHPGRDSACGPWEATLVNGRTENPQQHGGIAVGDIDGDGDIDLSRLDRWFENQDGKGRTWVEHANIDFGNWDPAAYGLSGRALIVDINGDGHHDLLQTECDLPNGRVAWFENQDGKGLGWKTHLIKDSTDGQDFHSLLYSDFDKDGDGDVFSAGSSHSSGARKAYLWENLDGKGGTWKEHILLAGEFMIHDAAAGDMDGDGDTDVLAKNFGEGTHFWLVNQGVPNTGLDKLRKPRRLTRPSQTSPGRNAKRPDLRGQGRAPAYIANGRAQENGPEGASKNASTSPVKFHHPDAK